MELLIIDELGSYRGVERTPNGQGWVVPATLTRTGIFTYVEGGKVLKVLRHPIDVFADSSLATLAHCPVTVFHPKEREVTSSNYRQVNVGHLTSPSKLANKYIASKLVILDGDTGDKIDRKELCEISMGYRADYARNADGSFESGVYEGERYDRRQVNIRYNHVSLGPRGWGRAGSDVGIKLDGVEGDYLSSMDNVFADQVINDEADAAAVVTPPAPPAVVVVDAAQVAAERDREKARADMLQIQINTMLAAKPVAPAAPDPAAVAKRTSLEADAKVLAPDLKCDGLTDSQLKTSALGVFDSSIKTDSQSEAYIDAAFDFAVKHRKNVVASHQTAATVVASQAQSSVVTDSVASAEKDMHKRHASAYEEYNAQASKLPAR